MECKFVFVVEHRICNEVFVFIRPLTRVRVDLAMRMWVSELGKTKIPSSIIVLKTKTEKERRSNLTRFGICMKFNKLSFHLAIENSPGAARCVEGT